MEVLLDNLETPYFIIDEVALTKNINDFHQALERNWGNSIIGYSFKTNSLPWVLKHMKKIIAMQKLYQALNINWQCTWDMIKIR